MTKKPEVFLDLVLLWLQPSADKYLSMIIRDKNKSTKDEKKSLKPGPSTEMTEKASLKYIKDEQDP